MRHAPFAAAFIILLAAPAIVAQSRTSAKRAELIAEYCRRAAELAPGDAQAQFALGTWCRENGLEQKAEAAFRTAIALDGDHAGARDALGFVRYGLGWSTRAELEALRQKGPSSDAVIEEAEREIVDAPAADVEEPESEMTTDARSIDPDDPFAARVAAKKAWADAAAAEFLTTFETIESADFLIHTTLGKNHPSMKLLVNFLKLGRKTLVGFLGVRGRAELWPAKLQFILLRSQEEFERFADVIDGIPDVTNSGGAYVGPQGHTVLWKPTSEVVIHQMAETVFDYLDGSDRWVSWWLREGVGELLATQMLSEPNKPDPVYGRNYIYAQDALASQDGAVTIYTLLETRDYRPRERMSRRALAMTFVDFLYRNRRSGLHRLIKDLKSEEAPPPPASESEEELKRYFLSYLTFQQTAFQSHVGKVDKVEEGWKTWVESKAATFKPGNETPPRPGRASRP